MAEAAILSAVKVLGELVIKKASFLKGVEDQVKWLKDELERMQCFLKDASQKQSDNERIRKWICDIREVVQDAEDVIETFILKVDASSKSTWSSYLPKNVYNLNRIGKDIEHIRTRLHDIEQSRERYGIQNLGRISEGSDVEWRRQLSHWQKDEDLVGLEEDVELLLEGAILNDDEREGRLSVATIVGMGGIGKSTLARKLYTHPAVVDNDRFDSRAWVVVSSDFRPREIIQELMLQLLDSTEDKLRVVETMEKLSLPSLQQMLHERLLGRRYFVVVDDVWESKHWEALASVFPVEDTGSRLLLTSRNRDIAKYGPHVHEVKLLDSKKSWRLFMKKAFIDSNEATCPKHLKGVGREIVHRCGGLPLAITVVGGLLLDWNPSTTKWENVLRELNSHLGKSGSGVSTILELSYRNLSPELKSCFLCLSFFKEDAIIRAKKLIHVWIAHGLIQQESGENTVEEIGRSYLGELINRNMIQIQDLSKDGSVIRNCHVHDIIRELAITKAKEEMSFEVIREDGNSQSSNKPRHRALYCSTQTFIYSVDKRKHLRSLFCHGGGYMFDVNPSYWKSFDLLKILDFEDFKLFVLPDTVGGLTGLRYLGLRNSMMSKLPRTLGRLKKLEVLDIAKNDYVEVPNVIWKMDSLRHLYMPQYIISRSGPLRVDTLKNLQTLSNINTDSFVVEHLTQITSLRKLSISMTDSFAVEHLTQITSLQKLSISMSINDVNHACSSLESLVCLPQLKLRGQLTMLPCFPPNMTHLTLAHTWFQEDPMPVLEKLPKLSCLKLDWAYVGEEMVISDKGFSSLKILIFCRMYHLNNIEIVGRGSGIARRGGMPMLKRFEIADCPHLEGLPEELATMATFLGIEYDW